jgi:uncharacterized membrane protein YqaE (UPF0057 family)
MECVATKAGLIAPLYLSVSWVLTVSYQLLTDTAVRAIGADIGSVWPAAGVWISANIQTLVFIYAFTWIFVLSSVIPSAIVGEKRGVLAQYVVVLVLSILAFFMPDILFATFGIHVNQIVSSAAILQNPVVAILYLSTPYLFMVGMDLRGRSIRKRKEFELIKNSELTINRTYKLAADGQEAESTEEQEKTDP